MSPQEFINRYVELFPLYRFLTVDPQGTWRAWQVPPIATKRGWTIHGGYYQLVNTPVIKYDKHWTDSLVKAEQGDLK